MKKAQIEIIGLLVIVILIAFIILAAIWFITRQDTNILEPQRQNIKAELILDTMIKTNMDLDQHNIQNKLKDKIIECSNNPSSCNQANDQLTSILNKIFKNKEYFLKIENSAFQIIMNIPQNKQSCTNPVSTTASRILSVNPLIKATLTLCTKTFS